MSPSKSLVKRAPRAQCSLSGRLPNVFLADIVDLGYGGVGLRTTELPRFELPYKINLGTTSLNLEGRIVWTRFVEAQADENGSLQPIYRCGLQFDPSDTLRAAIHRFLIDNNAKALEGERATPRFCVDAGAPRLLFTSFPFQVITISRTGMLVSINQLPEPDAPVSLQVDLPSGTLNLTGRMVDVYQNIDRGALRTRVAFCFERPSIETTDRLDAFVNSQLEQVAVH